MKKKILALIFGVAATLGVLVPSGEVFAADPLPAECNVEFLGLRPWYYGLVEGSDCHVKSPTGCTAGSECSDAGDSLARFVWQIVLNVLIDLFVIAGVVAVGFLIYGGYLYLRSGGDPNFATKGRKTLTAALVGLIISVLANVIMRVITAVLTAAGADTTNYSARVDIINMLNWVYSIMGIVAVIGIVFGAIVWTTSQGDPTKVKKGRDAIIYAVIGLFIVLAATAITNLIIGAPNSGGNAESASTGSSDAGSSDAGAEEADGK